MNEKVKCKDLYDVPISQIIPYGNNPRKNDKAVKFVANSIKEVGYITPIIVDEEMMILAGDTRKKALTSLKYTNVPHVKQVFGLTPEQKKLFRDADNATNEAANWDNTKRFEELASIKGMFDLSQFFIKLPDEADLADEKYNDDNCKYPLVPQFSEKYDAIIVMFKNDIDFNNFAEKLGLEKVKSYKNSQQGQTRIVWFERLMECMKK